MFKLNFATNMLSKGLIAVAFTFALLTGMTVFAQEAETFTFTNITSSTTWETDTPKTIEWSGVLSEGGLLRLSYTTDQDRHEVSNLNVNVTGQSSYAVEINSANLPVGDTEVQFMLSHAIAGDQGNLEFYFSEKFTISNGGVPEATLEITGPSDNFVLNEDGTVKITWTSEVSETVELSYDCGNGTKTVGGLSASDSGYLAELGGNCPANENGEYNLSIKLAGVLDGEVVATAPSIETLTWTIPEIEEVESTVKFINETYADKTYEQGDSIAFAWETNVDIDAIGRVTLHYYTEDVVAGQYFRILGISGGDQTSGVHNWPVATDIYAGMSSKSYITVRVMDADNNVIAQKRSAAFYVNHPVEDDNTGDVEDDGTEDDTGTDTNTDTGSSDGSTGSHGGSAKVPSNEIDTDALKAALIAALAAKNQSTATSNTEGTSASTTKASSDLSKAQQLEIDAVVELAEEINPETGEVYTEGELAAMLTANVSSAVDGKTFWQRVKAWFKKVFTKDNGEEVDEEESEQDESGETEESTDETESEE